MKTSKEIIVTGASSGIGFSIAQSLLQQGFDIHMIAHQSDSLNRAQGQLTKYGNVGFSVVDLSDRQEVKNFCDKWQKPILGLVNNAGRWSEERLDDPDKDIWDPIMKLNLEGLYFLTKGLQSTIINSGRIVNISSQLGTGGRVGMGIYAASKHAVIGLTRCWALEMSDREITVNAVCPGWVNTQSNRIEIENWAKEEGVPFNQKMDELARPLALHRFIEPEEVANLVTFLIQPTGSGITGQVYEIK